MKSWMFAAILLCGTSMSAQAQEYYQTKDEVAVTIGGGTNSQLFDAFSRLFGVMGEALVTGIMTGGHYVGTTTYDNEKYIPALSVEYFHHVSPMVSIGGIAAFNGYSSDMFCNWQTSDHVSTKEKIGTAKKYNITVMPAVKFDWVRKKNFGVYTKIGIGATYMYEKEVQKNGWQTSRLHFSASRQARRKSGDSPNWEQANRVSYSQVSATNSRRIFT